MQRNTIEASHDSFFYEPNNTLSCNCPNNFNAKMNETICLIKSNQINEIQVKISGQYIDIGEQNYLNIENAIVRKIFHSKTNMLGIRLTKGKQKIDFFGCTQEFQTYLKKFIIQQDFKDKFQVFKKIGEGFLSKVYMVKNTINGQYYAVKVYDKQQISVSQMEIEFFQKELYILRNFSHPNMQQLSEVYESKNQLYIVFNFISNIHLGDKLNKPLPENTVVKIMKPLFEMVEMLHQNGIYHGDIVAENLILTDEDDISSICLIHFGSSSIYNQNYNNNNKIKFTQIQLNEQDQQRQIEFKQKVDIYSLCLIMYSLTIGKSQMSKQKLDELLMKNYYHLQHLLDSNMPKRILEFLKFILYNEDKHLKIQSCTKHPIFHQQFIRHSIKLKSRKQIQFEQQDNSTPLLKQTSLLKTQKYVNPISNRYINSQNFLPCLRRESTSLNRSQRLH